MRGRMLRCLSAGLLLLCPLPLAAQEDCSRYSEFGLSLGMSNKQVWKAMGQRGEDAGRARSPRGYQSIERYDNTSTPILVHYGGTVSKKSSARVVSIETTFEENITDVPELMVRLRNRLGLPSSGADNLENGLEGGAVEWTNPECDVVVTLFRRAAPWWEPAESAEFHVKIDALSFLQSGKLTNEPMRAGAEPPPPQTAAAAAPPPPVVEPAKESATISSPTANGQDVRSGDDSEPASSEASPTTEDPVIYVAGVNGVSHPTRVAGESPVPRLPASARSRVIDGRVLLEVVVRKDGTVADIVVLQANPSGLGLEQAATRAVKKWRYDPAELDGEPVDARINVSFRFR